jgi:mRNA-degrading endonuclease toxin of MazEF toxin-antitoxin module
VYYFKNTVWRLPDHSVDDEHPGIVLQASLISASVMLCTHKPPGRKQLAVKIGGPPLNDECFCYLRNIKVVNVPVEARYKGHLTAEQWKELQTQLLLNR